MKVKNFINSLFAEGKTSLRIVPLSPSANSAVKQQWPSCGTSSALKRAERKRFFSRRIFFAAESALWGQLGHPRYRLLAGKSRTGSERITYKKLCAFHHDYHETFKRCQYFTPEKAKGGKVHLSPQRYMKRRERRRERHVTPTGTGETSSFDIPRINISYPSIKAESRMR